MKNICLLLSLSLVPMTNAFAAAVEEVQTDTQSASQPSPAPVAASDSGALHIVWAPAYLWMTGLKGNIGVKNYAVPVNASFADVFDNLNLGYMGAIDLRKRRLGLLTDVVYSKLTTQETATPFGLLYSNARSRSKSLIVDPEFYGRVIETNKYSVDAFAGVRVWRLDNGLDLRAGLLPALSLDQTESWADPVLGGRFRANLPKNFFATFKGDAGIGPNETWQIYSGGGKEFRKKYDLILAYRRLDVHYRSGGFLFDTSMSGLLLGMTVRFR
jgi:opacity protein-like surface antigen